MRLLRVEDLELETFNEKDAPPYAILSHTWGSEEFLYEHVQDPFFVGQAKGGRKKVMSACKQAQRDGLDYIWVDSCCIDKSNGSELSEAINSMFSWYQNSTACYVYLEDVTLELDGTITNFETSKWFSRGWTLQELIAPHGLRFFDRNWGPILTRKKLSRRIAQITGIKEFYLFRDHDHAPASKNTPGERCATCGGVDDIKELLGKESIAAKMKWASGRTTTRPEDMAYCMMGLFDVNMSLLYGEGSKAFTRFQEEILKNRPDQSILAWTIPTEQEKEAGVPRVAYLPEDPSSFELDLFDKDDSRLGRDNITITPKGLEVDVLLIPCPLIKYSRGSDKQQHDHYYLGVLSCSMGNDSLARVAIILQPLGKNAHMSTFARVFKNTIVLLDAGAKPKAITNSKEERVDFSITANLEDFKHKRILLQAVPPSTELNHNIPVVKMVIESFADWHITAQYPEFGEGGVLDRSFDAPGDAHIHPVVGRGIFCFTDDDYAFVAMLVADNTEKGYLSTKARYYCWIETWKSFTEDVDDELQDPSPEALKGALQVYIKNLSKKGFVRPPSETTEGPYKAKGRVKSTDFLGRMLHTLEIEIQPSGLRMRNGVKAVDARWYQLSKKIDNYADDAIAHSNNERG